jgi:hypothetical protein
VWRPDHGDGDLGLIKEGFLADMLLVDGDPTADIKLMRDKNKLLMIMKDGSYHQAPQIQSKDGFDAHRRKLDSAPKGNRVTTHASLG